MLAFKKMQEALGSPLLGFNNDPFEQCKRWKELDEHEGCHRGAGGPLEEEKDELQGSRQQACKNEQLFRNGGAEGQSVRDQHGVNAAKVELKKDVAGLALSDSSE